MLPGAIVNEQGRNMNKADRIAQVPGLLPSSPPAHASAVLKSWAADSTRTPCRSASARAVRASAASSRATSRSVWPLRANSSASGPADALRCAAKGTQFLALSRQSANDLVLGIGGTGRTSSHLIHKGFSWKPTLKGALAGKALLGQWKTPCEVPSEVAAKMT
jgi:hypothetical protein